MANINYLSNFNLDLVKKTKLKLKLNTWLIYSLLISILILFFSNLIVASVYFLISSFIIKEFYLAKNLPNGIINGYLGEKHCLKLLKKLPKEYIIFNQIEIPSPESTFNEFETDFIIVGENTLFIVECKHYSGTVTCKDEYEDWVKQEYNQYGKLTKHYLIKSPFRQIKRQRNSLNKFLKKLNIELHIQTLLFLDMHEDDVDLPTVANIPVFTNKNLIKHIKNTDKEFYSFETVDDRSTTMNILISINQESIKSRKERLTNKKYLLEYYETD